ncbi:MAG: hypothetical protein L3J46_02500 [Kangiellaceae bacterium]|nr:hypothetical protein [Kangiellaceae bacterium]
MSNTENMDKRAGLTQEQLDAHWMPCTGNRQIKKDPRLIVSAKGKYYTSDEGKNKFEGV